MHWARLFIGVSQEKYLKPPSHYGVEIPEQSEAAVMQALRVRPEDRFQSIAEFQRAIRTAVPFLAAVASPKTLDASRRAEQRGAAGRLRQIIEASKTLLRGVIHPANPSWATEGALRSAEQALQAARYDEAISALDTILVANPNHREAQNYRQIAIEWRQATPVSPESVTVMRAAPSTQALSLDSRRPAAPATSPPPDATRFLNPSQPLFPRVH
jgi:hypothetical protein